MDGSLALKDSPTAHQRATGALRLAVQADTGTEITRLADLYHAHPMRALFPRAAPGDPFTAALATVSGGLAGGDQVEIDLTVGRGADMLVVSQAAEKVYRAIDGLETRVDVSIAVAADATLEFLPQETILFDGARQHRTLRVSLEGEGGRLLAGDMTVYGRGAMGEIFTRGHARETWTIDHDGVPLWRDSSFVTGEVLAHPFGLDGAAAMGTIISVASDPEAVRDVSRDAAGFFADVSIGATTLGPLTVVRLIGRDAAATRIAFQGLWVRLRHHALGRPARLPALIHC